MKIAVITDIHGNLEAFSSVLADIRQQHVDAVVSLGDNIGYGADSEAVVQSIQKENIVSITGNHELAANNPNVLKWFHYEARQAVEKTLESLSEKSRQYIRGLKSNYRMADCLFVHGFPPDSARFYLFQISDDQLMETFRNMEESICFVGHTHKLRMVYPEDEMVRSQSMDAGHIRLDREKKYIINAGSVGQPRDGDLNSKYVIWDSSAYDLDIRFVPYDVSTAAKKIMDAGIPEKYALCLKGEIL